MLRTPLSTFSTASPHFHVFSRQLRSDMPANQPNESVLLLFDPLSTPETPPRNTNSPDSSSSDKENDAASQQPGPVTVFFNRIYKENPVPSIKSPKGRLIDFGDASFVSQCGDEENLEEKEAHGAY